MNPKLAALHRKLNLQPDKAPAPESGLGAQIEALVADAVQMQVADAIERKQPARMQRLLDDFNRPKPTTDYRQLPLVQKTAPAKNMSAQIMRDGAGLARWVQIGDCKFEALRDSNNMLVGMRQLDENPVLPALDIPFKAEAREYQEGV